MLDHRSQVPPARRALLRIWLAVETVAALLVGVLWLAAVALSFTAFGAPGTAVDARAWAFVVTLWGYPIWTGVPLVLAWASLAGRRQRAALLLSLVPPAAGAAATLLFRG